MAPDDLNEVNEADRIEQEMPPARDERDVHPVPPDAPTADVLEQELPVVEQASESGLDAERVEPIADDDWATSAGG